MNDSSIRVAILDLYDGAPNQGMRCIKEIVENANHNSDCSIQYDVFDVRGNNQIADLSYDLFIGTGGPGCPIESAGSEWERSYFGLMDDIKEYNLHHPDAKKYVFLICHSFQIFCRYYELGKVSKRQSTSFGVMPIHMTASGQYEPFFEGLSDPFWAVDSRDYQVTEADLPKIRQMGGDVLCIEKYRPQVKLERCMMAIRFDDAFFGTQFHPEADSEGMLVYMKTEERKKQVIESHGEEKYYSMMEHLNDPDKIILTHNTILPLFLEMAINSRKELISR